MSYCSAKRSNGEPCKGQAITGATVCRVHGGNAPQVRDAARRRIAEMVQPALAKMLSLMSYSQDDKVQFQAAKDILDRYGLKEADKVEVSGGEGGPVRFILERIGDKS